MKNIILSYDYELFFGDRSGTVQKSLIEPTNQLMDAMESVGFRGNFFIDWQMLKYLNLEEDELCQRDYTSIVEQLKDMVHRGHRIELHIHPHWVDAKYNGDGTWDFGDFRHYSLNSFSKNEITEMFIEGTSLLESIAREVEPDYKIIAFRAGGWAVQPFDMLIDGFKQAGIKIDSSVAHGLKAVNKDSYYNFEDSPRKPMYRFSDDVCVEDECGSFIEVPISVFRCNLFYKVIEKLYAKSGKTQRLTDGTHSRASNASNRPVKGKSAMQVLKVPTLMLTFSQLSPITVFISVLSHQSQTLCFIDHPKDFSKSTMVGIKILKKICKTIQYKILI